MELAEIIEKRIRDALKQKGMEHADLAKAMGISRASVSQMLGRNIRIKTLFEIAVALNLNPAVLVDAKPPGKSAEERRLLLVRAVLRAKENELRTLEDAAAELLTTPSGGETGSAGSTG